MCVCRPSVSEQAAYEKDVFGKINRGQNRGTQGMHRCADADVGRSACAIHSAAQRKSEVATYIAVARQVER